MNTEQKRSILKKALKYASTTKVFICEEGALDALPGSIQKLYPGAPVILTADENTWEAAGRQAQSLLRSEGIETADPYIFPAVPMVEATCENAELLCEVYRRTPGCIPIAAGSGTINDLVKRGAFMAGRPYAVAATASSVDGYASEGAALLKGGNKITIPCPAPEVIIGDTDILKTAPRLLTSSGYADLAAKIPAGSDWIIADHMGEDPINRVSWDLVQGNLLTWLQDPADTEGLFIGLTLCGIAMQYQESTRPVSGAEHLLSHVWEMHHHTYQGSTVLHGIKVGIGTLITTAATEWLLRTGPIEGEDADYQQLLSGKQELLTREFSRLPGIGQLQATLLEKYSPPRRREERKKQIAEDWDILSIKIRNQLVSYLALRDMLLKADCPVRSEDIGISKAEALDTMRISQLIRNRYSILDVLDDLGLLERCIRELKEDPSVLS